MQVTVKLPPSRRTEKEEDDSLSGSGSGGPAEPEEGDKSDPKSINQGGKLSEGPS